MMKALPEHTRNRARSGLLRTLAALLPMLLIGLGPANAQDAGPTPDTVLQKLVQLDPAAMAKYVHDIKEKAAALEAESKQLKAKAGELENQAQALKAKVDPFLAAIKSLAESQGMAPKPKEQAMGGEKEMAAEAEMAAAKPSVTFMDQVLPIFQQRCFSCHGNGQSQGGLSLMSFRDAMRGGSSGEVIEPGNPNGSRLFKLVSRTEEPFMPKDGPPLTDEQLATIREWITLGAPENADSKVMVAKKTDSGDEPVFIAAEMSDGPPPMPEVPLQPVSEANQRGIVARSIATSPTAPLAALAGDREILFYSLEDYSLLGALPFPRGDIYTMTFSLNGELLLAGGGEESFSQAVALYDVRKAKRIGEYGKGFDTVLAADISPDHRMVATGGPDKKVRVYASGSGDLLYELDPHTDWIYSVKFSPDGELLATADRQGGLHLWQASIGRHVENLRGHEGAIHDMAYTIDSNILATAGGNGTVILWDTWKYREIRRFNAHSGAALSVDWNDAGQLITSGEDGLTKRWDANGKNLASYPKQSDWVYQASFGAGGTVVLSGDWAGQIAVWNAESGEPVANLTTNPTPDLMLANSGTKAGEDAAP